MKEILTQIFERNMWKIHAFDHWLIDIDCLGFNVLQPYNGSKSESDICGWDMWKRYSMWKRYETEICERDTSV